MSSQLSHQQLRAIGLIPHFAETKTDLRLAHQTLSCQAKEFPLKTLAILVPCAPFMKVLCKLMQPKLNIKESVSSASVHAVAFTDVHREELLEIWSRRH